MNVLPVGFYCSSSPWRSAKWPSVKNDYHSVIYNPFIIIIIIIVIIIVIIKNVIESSLFFNRNEL